MSNNMCVCMNGSMTCVRCVAYVILVSLYVIGILRCLTYIVYKYVVLLVLLMYMYIIIQFV